MACQEGSSEPEAQQKAHQRLFSFCSWCVSSVWSREELSQAGPTLSQECHVRGRWCWRESNLFFTVTTDRWYSYPFPQEVGSGVPQLLGVRLIKTGSFVNWCPGKAGEEFVPGHRQNWEGLVVVRVVSSKLWTHNHFCYLFLVHFCLWKWLMLRLSFSFFAFSKAMSYFGACS